MYLTPSLCEGLSLSALVGSEFAVNRACVVTREKVTPVTLVCGR